MATGTERSKALHNFTMPCDLRWANQKYLRCMRVNSDGQISPHRRFTAHSSDHPPIKQRRTTRDRDRDSSSEFVHGSPVLGPTPPPRCEVGVGRRVGDGDDDGIAAMREKVMFDLQTAAHKMKTLILKDGLEEQVRESFISPPVPTPSPSPASAEVEACRPWNLRTRRAASKTPLIAGRNCGAFGNSTDGNTVKGLRLDSPRPNSGFSQIPPSSTTAADAAYKSSMHLSDSGASGEKKERAKFSVTLSKREIEEDFSTMDGRRPSRRPKKRAKMVQKQIESLFPGFWLIEVTADMYKVPDSAP